MNEIISTRIKNLGTKTPIFTIENICMLIFLASIYILYRNILYKSCDILYEKMINYRCTYFVNIDPRVYNIKVKPSIRRTLSGLFLTLFGIFCLRDQNWIFNRQEYFYFYNPIPLRIKMQYAFEFNHYFVSIYFLISDPRTKDFFEMLVHHILTCTLIFFSYQKNYFRYGIVIMVLHDISDPLLELGKVCQYFELKSLMMLFFFLFSFAFTVFRFLIFPCLIVVPIIYYSIFYKVYSIAVFWGSLLMLLYVLNVIWMWYIFDLWRHFYVNGEIRQDNRSYVDEEIKND